MKLGIQLLLASLVTFAAAAAQAAPSITGSDPTVMVADVPGYDQVHTITLYGSGLALPTTTGYTIDTDVQVWVTGLGHGWTLATRTDPWFRVNSWSTTTNTVTLLGLPQPGTLTFAICVGGSCGYYNATVRARTTTAPRLTYPDDTTYAPFASTLPPGDPSRLTYFSASGLNDVATTCLYIEGYGPITSFGRLDAGDGWGFFYLPNLSLGDHRIWISNNGCGSSAHWSVNNWIHVYLTWTPPHFP